MKSSRKLVVAVFVALLASTALLAQDIPLRNWTVPPFDASMFKQSGPSIRPMTDIQGNTPAVFVPVNPCRLEDSRTTAAPPGPGPIGSAGVSGERAYDFIPSGGDLCGAAPQFSFPIVALSLNFTVLDAFGAGFMYAYPTGGTPPPVAIINYTGAPGEIRNNAAIVPVYFATGSFTVGMGVNGANVIIDINGIFLAVLEPDTTFQITSSTGATAILGLSANGIGVQGTSTGYIGVLAQSTNWDALAAFGGRDGGYLEGARHGVIGVTNATTGAVYGVLGSSASGSSDAAGVLGTSGPIASVTSWQNAGARGEAGFAGIGVLGISQSYGTLGVLVNSAGATQTYGMLGTNFGDDPRITPDPVWAVFGQGHIGASGTKYFLDPHPTDPSKVIGYISLEGPEAGTYFRGRARFQNGMARIEVPEHFRMVTDPEGLTVQITPIGGMATVGVLRADLNEIVVQSSRNLEFSYLVQGVRSTFKDTVPVWQGNEFRPRSADEKLPSYFSEGQRARLIANGTYKSDGTVNMETAQRLGWDKIWEARRPAPNPE